MKVAAAVAGMVLAASAAQAQPLTCTMTGYTAVVRPDGRGRQRRADAHLGRRGQPGTAPALAISGGTPTIRELAVRTKGGRRGRRWPPTSTPEFRVVTGLRRATEQQIQPLRDLGVEITPEVIDDIKWEAFWDAPLNVPGDDDAHGDSTPPKAASPTSPGCRASPKRSSARRRPTRAQAAR